MKAYNQRILRTGSYVEIWTYDKPIITHNDEPLVVDINDSKPRQTRKSFDELTPEEQKVRLEHMATSRLQAKWRLLRIVDANYDDRTSFLTLTTKQNIQDRSEFLLMFKKFINRFNYQIFGKKKGVLHYVAVLERQKRGSWHSHILMFSVPYVKHSELLKIWGHGAVRINKVDVDSKENRGRYVVKYFEKGIGQELLDSFGKKSYFASRNLKKPTEEKILLNENLEFDQSVVLYETTYVSKIYRDNQLIDNPVRYRKIKYTEDKNSGL